MTDNQLTTRPSSGVLDRYMPGSFEENAEGAQVDMSTIRAILWRQRYIIVGLLALALGAGIVVTMLATPRYEATATLRINLASGSIIDGLEIEPYIAANEYARYAQTLSDVVESRSTALKVVDALDLQDSEELFGEAVRQSGEADVAARRESAAGMLTAGVVATAPLETRILSITFNSSDPGFAALVANTYADQFVQSDISEGMEANTYAIEYLQQQIESTRERLQDAERRANDYARSNRLVDQPAAAPASGGDGAGAATSTTLAAANLGTVNSQYVQARAARLEAEQRWRTVANVPASQLPEVQLNLEIRRMRADLDAAQDQLSQLRLRLGNGHPQVQEVLGRIASLERDIEVEGTQIKAAIQRDYQVARAREAAFNQELSHVTDLTLDEQDRRVPYTIIEREVSGLRDLLDALLARYNEVSSAANLRSNDVSLLDTAMVPQSPSSPSLMRNLIVSLALGLGLAAGVALLREILDNRLRTVDDVEERFRLTVLGHTPIAAGGHVDVLEDPFGPVSEAYASIRATLDFQLRGEAHPVVQVTSTMATEGKTTTAIALAQKYAAQGKRVLLLDLDLRRPSINKALQVKYGEADLMDVLLGRSTLEQALTPTASEGLFLLGLSSPIDNPVEILSSGLVYELLQRERNQFDLILVDSSPVLGIADAPLVSRFVDGLVFVIEANRANVGQTRAALRRLRNVNAKVLGAVLTKFQPLNAGQGYDYQYRYYRYETETPALPMSPRLQESGS